MSAEIPTNNPEKKETSSFIDKFNELLPGVEFEEPSEMDEARTAVLAALAEASHDPKLLREVWIEYSKICEKVADEKTLPDTDPHARAQLQIAMVVHKALIFREVSDIQRYGEELEDAREYAFNEYFDEIVQAIDSELDSL